MADASMNVDLKLNAKGNARRKVEEVARGMSVAGGSAARLGRIGYLGFAGIAAAAASAGALIAGAFAFQSIKVFVEFEDSLVRTQAIMRDLSDNEAEKLRSTIEELGRTTRFTAREVADATQTLAVAGISFDEMVGDKAIEKVLQFAQAGGVTMAEAASIGIAGVKGFRLEMDQLERVGDVLTTTFTNSNTTITDLGETLKLAAPTMASAGVSLEETAAAAGTLGNAGIKGTMAGTGLRRAITQLLKPSDTARKLMVDLGLSIFTLSPAGATAQSALGAVSRQLDSARERTSSLETEMKALTDAMAGLSIEQMKNNLTIMSLKRRAEREGRALTDAEIGQIERLEGANQDLDISMQGMAIKQAQNRRESSEANDTEKELASTLSELNDTITMQATGITSLTDVMTQLGTAGATTAQIMELFGIRGGTAVQTLLGDMDGFVELQEKIKGSEGAMSDFALQIEDATAHDIKLFKSALEGLMIAVGERLAPVISKLTDEFVKPGGLFDVMLGTEEEAGPVVKMFEALADTADELLIPAIVGLVEVFVNDIIPAMPVMLTGFKLFLEIFIALLPIIRFVTGAMLALMTVISPMLQIVFALVEGLLGLLTLDTDTLGSALKSLGAGIGNLAFSPLNFIKASGFALGATDDASMAVDFNREGAMDDPDAAFGAFAEGGVVKSALIGMVGEAGPEIVMPLSKASEVLEPAMAKEFDKRAGDANDNSVNITIQSLHVVDTFQGQMVARDLAATLKQEISKGRPRSF